MSPCSERKLRLARGRTAAAGRSPGRLLEVGEDGALGAGGEDRLGNALDVDERAASVTALVGLERDDRVDAVRTDELAVAERDHAGGRGCHGSGILTGAAGRWRIVGGFGPRRAAPRAASRLAGAGAARAEEVRREGRERREHAARDLGPAPRRGQARRSPLGQRLTLRDVAVLVDEAV